MSALGLQQAERWYFYPKDGNWDYESMRSHLVADWVEGSKRPTSILLKYALKMHMGIGGEIYNPNNYSIPEKMVNSYSKVMKNMYENTQNYLHEENIKMCKIV